jgi:hypothetical protein
LVYEGRRTDREKEEGGGKEGRREEEGGKEGRREGGQRASRKYSRGEKSDENPKKLQ